MDLIGFKRNNHQFLCWWLLFKLVFVIEDTNGVEDGEDGLSNIEELDESMIDPTDQEQLLDDEIYLVEIEEEEADDYTRWSEPILQLIAVRDPKILK